VTTASLGTKTPRGVPSTPDRSIFRAAPRHNALYVCGRAERGRVDEFRNSVRRSDRPSIVKTQPAHLQKKMDFRGSTETYAAPVKLESLQATLAVAVSTGSGSETRPRICRPEPEVQALVRREGARIVVRHQTRWSCSQFLDLPLQPPLNSIPGQRQPRTEAVPHRIEWVL
jgi:hypothetical protein